MQLTEEQIEYFLNEDVVELDEEVAQYLIESRVDFIKNQHKDKITTDHDPESAQKTSDKIIDHISSKIDPTDKKEHTSWLVNRYKSGEYKLSDSKKIKKLLTKFVGTKKHLENQDINSYKSIDHLNDAVIASSAAKEVSVEKEKEKTLHDMPEIYNDSGVTGYKIPNKATSIANYGAGGRIAKCRWCTSADSSDNKFHDYKGGKYTLHMPTDEGTRVIQMNHSSGQTMDENNTGFNFLNGDLAEKYHKQIHEFAQKTADLEKMPDSRIITNAALGVKKFSEPTEPKRPLKDLINEHLANVDYVNKLASIGSSYYQVNNTHNETYSPLSEAVEKAPNIDSDDFEKLSNLKKIQNNYGTDLPDQKYKNFYTDEPDRGIRDSIITNRKISPEILDKLIQTGLYRQNSKLFSHPNLTDDNKHKIIGEIVGGQQHLLSGFLKNVQSLNVDHTRRIINSGIAKPEDFAEDKFNLPKEFFDGRPEPTLFKHKNLPHSRAKEVIEKQDGSQYSVDSLRNISRNTSIPTDLRVSALSHIHDLRSDSHKTFHDLLTKDDISQEDKDHLVDMRLTHKASSIRENQFSLFDTSAALTKDHVKRMLGNNQIVQDLNEHTTNVLHNPRVGHKEIQALLNNPSLSKQHISSVLATGKTKESNIDDILNKDKSDEIARDMVDNPTKVPLSPKHITHFLNLDNKYHDVVRFKALKHPSVRLSHFDIVKDDPKFHGLISGLKNAPPSILHLLATSPMDHVRSNVASNPNTEEKTLRILNTDHDPDVQSIANKKLSKLK